MPTVKLQNGNVLLKDGKVSCSCCAPPGCCMYSALSLVQERYAINDLPDAVTINGLSYSRSGTTYGDMTNGVRLEGSVWARYTNQARDTRPCLIQSGVADQFASSYNLSGDVGGWETYSVNIEGALLNRIDICFWLSDYILIGLSDGLSSGTCEINPNLIYYPEEQPYWGVSFGFRNWNVFDVNTGDPVPPPGYTLLKTKLPIYGAGISSPAGDYYQGDGTGQWTVS